MKPKFSVSYNPMTVRLHAFLKNTKKISLSLFRFLTQAVGSSERAHSEIKVSFSKNSRKIPY